MEEQSQGIVLAKTLDRLRACADGYQTKICLKSGECLKVCAYIWWLTDQIAYAKAKDREAIMQDVTASEGKDNERVARRP